MNENLTTKRILDMFDISRQTLYNWITSNQIQEPERDWRGWRIWRQEHIDQICYLIKMKQQENKDIVATETFEINNRRYLGNKYKLLPFIDDVVKNNCDNIDVVADVFAGTGVVADKFRKEGKKIIVNDILLSNYYSYLTWFGNEEVDNKKIEEIICYFNNTDIVEENYVSKNFGDTYFTFENASKIGYIREEIEKESKILNVREKAILITSLLYAMDKVANTCGHYDAYRRKLDSIQPLKLLLPQSLELPRVKNEIYRKDANQLVREIKADLVYIDTPYNSRQYGDAYHLLENIAEWKKPKVQGVARKMLDRSHIKSRYCTMQAAKAFNDLIGNIDSRYILVSYNNMAQKGVGRSNAKISEEEIIEILKKRGEVKVFDTDYRVFTTGKTNINEHKEILYLCECK